MARGGQREAADRPVEACVRCSKLSVPRTTTSDTGSSSLAAIPARQPTTNPTAAAHRAILPTARRRLQRSSLYAGLTSAALLCRGGRRLPVNLSLNLSLGS